MYKFYRIPDLDTLEKIVGLNPTIKFSSAFNLNDPYELKFNLKIDPFAKGQLEAFLKFVPGSTPKDFEQWQDQIADNNQFAWYVEQQQRSHLSQTITLCSFAGKNTNNLMWSHYTNNHSGICVEYFDSLLDEFKRLSSFFAYDKVQYSDFPPEVDSLEDPSIKISKMVFNKQSDWKYEQEIRVVLQSTNDTDFVPIDAASIKAIYIGSRASNGIPGRVIQICKNAHFDCYHAIAIGKTYDIHFEKNKDGTIFTSSFW